MLLAVAQQTGRDGHDGVPGQAATSQQDVHEGPAGAAVAVDEGVGGLELRVHQRGVHQGRDVLPRREGHQVLDRPRDRLVVGWDELGLVRPVPAAPDPDLLLPPRAGVVGRGVGEQVAVHRQHGVGVELGGGDGPFHGPHVAQHQPGVAGRVPGVEGGDGQGLRPGGDVLDLGAGRGLRPQQQRGERDGVPRAVGVEAGDEPRRPFGLGQQPQRQHRVEVGGGRQDRGAVLPRVGLAHPAGDEFGGDA